MLGTTIEDNERGGAIFSVTKDRSGNLVIDGSTLRRNPSDRFANYPGIIYLGSGPPQVTDSIIESSTAA